MRKKLRKKRVNPSRPEVVDQVKELKSERGGCAWTEKGKKADMTNQERGRRGGGGRSSVGLLATIWGYNGKAEVAGSSPAATISVFSETPSRGGRIACNGRKPRCDQLNSPHTSRETSTWNLRLRLRQAREVASNPSKKKSPISKISVNRLLRKRGQGFYIGSVREWPEYRCSKGKRNLQS